MRTEAKKEIALLSRSIQELESAIEQASGPRDMAILKAVLLVRHNHRSTSYVDQRITKWLADETVWGDCTTEAVADALRFVIDICKRQIQHVDAMEKVKTETRSLLRFLSIHGGWLPVRVDDGEELISVSNREEAVDACTAVDECKLHIQSGEQKATLFLVYGNCPGELVCDHSDIDQLSEAVSAWAQKQEEVAA